MKRAIYGFSGDPITYGHIDIIKRAKEIFGELIVGIGVNPTKKYFFNLEERRRIAEESLKSISNIQVIAFEGLLVDYAYENNISTVIRGIRNSEDLNYEMMLHQIGESQRQNIDTIYFPARQKLMHISSGAVKALQIEQGLIHEYVPLYVKQRLEERLSKQFIVGITGEIGVGKSYICNEFKKLAVTKEIPIHVIDVDKIGHQILGKLKEPLYVEFRKEIAANFGEILLDKNGFINRQKLGQIIFNSSERLDHFNKLLYKPLLLKLRRELYGKRGLIILDSALIAESKMTYLVNNNLIVVNSTKATQKLRLEKRGYTDDQITNRVKSQYTEKLKKQMIRDAIEKDYHGKLMMFENSREGNNENIEKLFEEIMSYFQIKK